MAFVASSITLALHNQRQSWTSHTSFAIPIRHVQPPLPRSATPPRRAMIFMKKTASDPTESLNETDRVTWDQVTTRVAQVLSPKVEEMEKVEAIVARAFGWSSQKFWRGRVKNQPPSLDTVNSSVDFLTNIILLDEKKVAKVVKKFPEILAMPLSRMQDNVNRIQRDYPSLKGDLLTRAVADNPAVLGYDFDCEGDCQSECARCWVQF